MLLRAPVKFVCRSVRGTRAKVRVCGGVARKLSLNQDFDRLDKQSYVNEMYGARIKAVFNRALNKVPTQDVHRAGRYFSAVLHAINTKVTETSFIASHWSLNETGERTRTSLIKLTAQSHLGLSNACSLALSLV